MAGASLLTLLDDISVILDDVSVMTKVAAKKTAGVLGDDLALNAEQVTASQQIVNCQSFGRSPKARLLISLFWCQQLSLLAPFIRL